MDSKIDTGAWREMTTAEREQIGNDARWLPTWVWNLLGGVWGGAAGYLASYGIITGPRWLVGVGALCLVGFAVNVCLALRDVDRKWDAIGAESTRQFNAYMSALYGSRWPS